MVRILRIRFQRCKDRLMHEIYRSRQRSKSEALVDAPSNGTFPDQYLLERINILENAYLLVERCWAYPQLRQPRYWNRRQMWATIEEMRQTEEAITLHMLQLEQAFTALTSTPIRSGGMLNESSVRLPVPGAYPVDKFETLISTLTPTPVPPSPLPSPFDTDSKAPHTAVNSFLTTYYLSLHEMRVNVRRWRKGLQVVADEV